MKDVSSYKLPPDKDDGQEFGVVAIDGGRFTVGISDGDDGRRRVCVMFGYVGQSQPKVVANYFTSIHSASMSVQMGEVLNDIKQRVIRADGGDTVPEALISMG